MTPNTLNQYVADSAANDQPRAVLYARQSKLNEDGSDASPVMQWEAGEAQCAARGYRVVHRFKDVGKSGWDPSTQRDGFEEMMRWVREGKCDVVVIFTLSRLTRMGAQEAFAIEKEMRDHGVSLVSVREPYLDTSDPIGAGIFAIIAGLAKQESDTKSAFITNTKELARKAGGHVSGTAPFWGTNDKAFTEDGVKYIKIMPTEEGRQTVLLMRDMAEKERLTPGEIADKLTDNPDTPPPGWRTEQGKARVEARRKRGTYKAFPDKPRWTPQAVLRTLRDPRIAGMAANRVGSDKWEIRRNADGDPINVHEPIIAPAEWYVLQIAISTEGKHRREYHGGTYLLTGWPFMHSYCGATMSTTITKGVPRYRSNREVSAARQMGKQRVSIQVEATDEYVAQRVWARVINADPKDDEDATLLTAAAQRFARQHDTAGIAIECNELEAQIKHTQESLRQIYADRKAGLYKGAVGHAAFTDAVRSMQLTEETCTARLRKLREEQTNSVRLPVDNWIEDAGTDPIGPGTPWSKWTMAQRRDFLKLWVDHVEIHPGTPGRKEVVVSERVVIHWARPLTEETEDEEDFEDLPEEAA
jgi:DNA invertase Pin-like site-specific DNA recombinase